LDLHWEVEGKVLVAHAVMKNLIIYATSLRGPKHFIKISSTASKNLFLMRKLKTSKLLSVRQNGSIYDTGNSLTAKMFTNPTVSPVSSFDVAQLYFSQRNTLPT
jgi:hypothetical protein